MPCITRLSVKPRHWQSLAEDFFAGARDFLAWIDKIKPAKAAAASSHLSVLILPAASA